MASDEEEQADEQGEEEESGAIGGGASEDGAFGSMPTEEQLPGMQQANTTRYAHPTFPWVVVEDPKIKPLQNSVFQRTCIKLGGLVIGIILPTTACAAAVTYCAVTNIYLYNSALRIHIRTGEQCESISICCSKQHLG